ncbi:MAG: TetR family transcriptional regulator [Solirubrobacterales bacterium]
MRSSTIRSSTIRSSTIRSSTIQRSASGTADKTDTRERIIRATLRVIGEHGIGAVSNRVLASEAGVALGSLTYHFPSQTDLLRESLMLYVQEEIERLNGIAEVLRRSAPTAAEVAVEIERVVTSAKIGPEQIAELELHLHAARDPQLHEASNRCFEAYDDVAVAALEALGVPNAGEHARSVVALLTGLALRRLGSGEHEATGTAVALMTLVRGMQVPPTRADA